MTTTSGKEIQSIGLMRIIKARKERFNMLAKAPLNYPEVFMFNIPGRKAYVIHQPE